MHLEIHQCAIYRCIAQQICLAGPGCAFEYPLLPMLPKPVWNVYVSALARTKPIMHVKSMVQWFQTNKSDLTHILTRMLLLLYIVPQMALLYGEYSDELVI